MQASTYVHCLTVAPHTFTNKTANLKISPIQFDNHEMTGFDLFLLHIIHQFV